jgi:hypothetical protein
MAHYFNWKYYISKYKDLQNANINTYEKALYHWKQFGLKEGRICNKEFEKFDYNIYKIKNNLHKLNKEAILKKYYLESIKSSNTINNYITFNSLMFNKNHIELLFPENSKIKSIMFDLKCDNNNIEIVVINNDNIIMKKNISLFDLINNIYKIDIKVETNNTYYIYIINNNLNNIKIQNFSLENLYIQNSDNIDIINTINKYIKYKKCNIDSKYLNINAHTI